MAPAIPDKSCVLVHAPEKRIVFGSGYVFNLDGQACITRLMLLDMGRNGRPDAIMLTPDKPSYPPMSFRVLA